MSVLTHRFTTDGSGAASGMIARTAGGILGRVLLRYDTPEEGVSPPTVTLTVPGDSGNDVQVYQGSLAVDSPQSDIIVNVPAGTLMLDVTGADADTEYVLSIWIVGRGRRLILPMPPTDEFGNTDLVVARTHNTLLEGVAVTSPDIDPDTSNVDVTITVATNGEYREDAIDVYDGTLPVNGIGLTDDWDVCPAGNMTIHIGGELTTGTRMSVVLDFFA